MLDGPTPWFILRQRLGLARRGVLLVALTVLLASTASVAGAVRYDAATAAPAVATANPTSADCATISRGAGFAVVPDHSRQLPAPSSRPYDGASTDCRQLRSLAPRQEPLSPGR